MPSISNTASLSDSDAWAALVDPLSVEQRKRLSWLRSKMDAVCWQDAHNEPVDFAYAKRLAFARFLYASGRLTDEVRAPLESLKAGEIQ